MVTPKVPCILKSNLLVAKCLGREVGLLRSAKRVRSVLSHTAPSSCPKLEWLLDDAKDSELAVLDSVGCGGQWKEVTCSSRILLGYPNC